jgi:hypothetical protein
VLKVEQWPIERLVPYARNPRRNDAAVDQMAGAIQEFGFRIPIVAKSDGSVVDGHLRLKAAQKLGLETVPVALADELSDAQITAFRLLVNRSANWAEWDEELLKLELADLKALDYNLELTGFDERELDRLLPSSFTEEAENAVPELPESAITQPGDLWILGSHRLLCGDCTKAEDVGRLLAGVEPALMVTDPPYGIQLDSEWRDRAGLNGHGPAEPSYMNVAPKGTGTPPYRETPARIGPKPSRWFRVFKSLTSGMHRNSLVKSWMACCALASYTISRLSGTRAEPCLRALIIGFSTSPAGMCARKMLLGLGKRARTPPFGFLHLRNSLWAAQTRRSSTTRHRNPSR